MKIENPVGKCPWEFAGHFPMVDFLFYQYILISVSRFSILFVCFYLCDGWCFITSTDYSGLKQMFCIS